MVRKTVLSHLTTHFHRYCMVGACLLIPFSGFGVPVVTWNAESNLFTVQSTNSTVKDVLDYIEANSDYIFVYSEDVQGSLDGKVSISVSDKKIDTVLDELFSKTDLDYTKNGRQITITEAKNVQGVQQQSTVTIKGSVKDVNGEGLIGASVAVKGSATGTITDIDGNFMLDVPSNSTVVVSYIGYLSQELSVKGRKTINVVLKEDTQTLEEVVVIGYGTQRKSDLTGGLVSVGKEELNMVQSSNLMDRLAGQIPGLNVTTGDATPGANQTLLIRGENSLSADNSPLVVLDGIPYNGSLSDIDPNIIENLSVLKDASAAAIYGSRGSNGVILIQTKKGQKGAAKVSYKGQVRLSQPQQTIDVMTPDEYIVFKQDIARLKDGLSGDQLAPEKLLSVSELYNYERGIINDWQDLIFRNALSHEHQVSISGGTESTTYMAAVSYLSQQGVVENSAMERYNMNFSVNQVLNKWLTIGLQAQFVQRDGGGITPNIEHAVKQSPYGIFKDENGNYQDEPMDQSLIVNPFANVNADQDSNTRNFFLNTFADILLPVKGLSFRTTFGYNFRNNFTGTYYGRNTLDGKKVDGKGSISSENYWDYTWENLLKYTRDFGKHHIDVTGLFSVQQTQKKGMSESAESFVNDDSSYYNLNAGEKKKTTKSSLQETSMLSYMLRLNYSFASRYMLTLKDVLTDILHLEPITSMHSSRL